MSRHNTSNPKKKKKNYAKHLTKLQVHSVFRKTHLLVKYIQLGLNLE